MRSGSTGAEPTTRCANYKGGTDLGLKGEFVFIAGGGLGIGAGCGEGTAEVVREFDVTAEGGWLGTA